MTSYVFNLIRLLNFFVKLTPYLLLYILFVSFFPSADYFKNSTALLIPGFRVVTSLIEYLSQNILFLDMTLAHGISQFVHRI